MTPTRTPPPIHLPIRRLGLLIAATSVVLAAAAAPAHGTPSIKAEKIVDGLGQPVAFTFGPGDKIWYVEKSSGEIHTYDMDTAVDERFFTVSGVDASGERGLLGIALHPNYPSKPWVYAYATRSVNGHLRNQIVRLTDANGRGRSLKVVFTAPASSSPYHNGGRILFGPDGMLYAIVGEGHDPSNAQDLTRNDRGKILRMRPNGAAPDTNPFSHSRIWAYGIRNSFGFAFDPETGDLWETENGPECNDELNRIRKGKDFGWGPSETCSGTSPQNTNQDGPNPVMPLRWYTPTIAPTGLAFCEKCGLGTASDGDFLFGADNTAEIRRVSLNDTRTDIRGVKVVYTHSSEVLSLEVGPGGTIYFSDFGGIFKLTRTYPAGPGRTGTYGRSSM